MTDEDQNQKMDPKDSENDTKSSSSSICRRCGGTGLICGYKPEILPGACCVDFANTICPDCQGKGTCVKSKNNPS